MPSLHGHFVWYELMTADPSAAKAFYGAVAGWSVTDVPMPGMNYTILSAGPTRIGGLMGIAQDPEHAGIKPFWSAYIAVDDVDAAAGKVERLGGSVCRAPADIPDVGRFAVVADPQGAVFNLFKALQPAEPAASMLPGRFNWHELNCRNWRAAFDFYSALFGWHKGDSVDLGNENFYQLFTIDGTAAGGMFDSPAAQLRCFWLLYIGVENIDAAAERVAHSGGRILNGPLQVPGGTWILQATDPQGAVFALVGPRPQP